jgi:ubiquinone/menaquinone biosynthesis C-methylase UbiE
MLQKAGLNTEKSGILNVTFIHSLITSIPQVPDSTADVIISNCVINLVPDVSKHIVFTEMFRLLKPGGSGSRLRYPVGERLTGRIEE